MRIELRPAKDATGKPVVYQSQLPPEQQPKKSRAKKGEADAPQPVEMTDDERAILESEKAELVSQLQARVPRPSPTSAPVADKLESPAASASHDDSLGDVLPSVEVRQEAPAPQVQDLSLTAGAAAAAVSERQRLEADLAALTQQLAAARLREQAAKQAAVRAQQAQVQAEGSAALAPYVNRLERHRDAVARVQARYGPILKEAARSMASGATEPERRIKAGAYRQAGLLGARLGDARASIEDALRRVTLDSQSARPEHHAQAKTLAEAALTLNVITLETEVKSLVQSLHELNPHLTPTTTPDRMPPVPEPQGRPATADLGRSILG